MARLARDYPEMVNPTGAGKAFVIKPIFQRRDVPTTVTLVDTPLAFMRRFRCLHSNYDRSEGIGNETHGKNDLLARPFICHPARW